MTVANHVLPASGRRLDAIDLTLFVVYLLGLYLGVSLPITSTIPLTCAPSGFAGLLLLWKRRGELQPRQLAGLLLVVVLYLGSIFSASDITFLGKRFTGLLQLTYSLVIGFAVFLTMVEADRRQIAGVLLAFCLCIIAGCALEEHTGLRAISDKVREHLYDAGQVYAADRRDQILYGRIRPKLFTSEPSAVTFAYTQYSALWLVISRSRLKFPIFAGLVGLALVVLPGPTLMLMILLAIPYIMFLGNGERRPSASRLIGAAVLSGVVLTVAIVLGQTLFAARIHQLQAGQDASFFYRFTGPMLVAFDMFKHHPWAGSGLTGEPYIANEVMNVYMNSPSFESAWQITKVADAITNYFWLHWIYLGAVWGVAMIVGISVWLRWLGSPSVLYCWAVWAILGQASGAYVGPKTWAVMLMAAAASVMVSRSERVPAAPHWPMEPMFARHSYPQLARSGI
jgi:hypothetical protein